MVWPPQISSANHAAAPSPKQSVLGYRWASPVSHRPVPLPRLPGSHPASGGQRPTHRDLVSTSRKSGVCPKGSTSRGMGTVKEALRGQRRPGQKLGGCRSPARAESGRRETQGRLWPSVHRRDLMQAPPFLTPAPFRAVAFPALSQKCFCSLAPLAQPADTPPGLQVNSWALVQSICSTAPPLAASQVAGPLLWRVAGGEGESKGRGARETQAQKHDSTG